MRTNVSYVVQPGDTPNGIAEKMTLPDNPDGKAHLNGNKMTYDDGTPVNPTKLEPGRTVVIENVIPRNPDVARTVAPETAQEPAAPKGGSGKVVESVRNQTQNTVAPAAGTEPVEPRAVQNAPTPAEEKLSPKAIKVMNENRARNGKPPLDENGNEPAAPLAAPKDSAQDASAARARREQEALNTQSRRDADEAQAKENARQQESKKKSDKSGGGVIAPIPAPISAPAAPIVPPPPAALPSAPTALPGTGSSTPSSTPAPRDAPRPAVPANQEVRPTNSVTTGAEQTGKPGAEKVIQRQTSAQPGAQGADGVPRETVTETGRPAQPTPAPQPGQPVTPAPTPVPTPQPGQGEAVPEGVIPPTRPVGTVAERPTADYSSVLRARDARKKQAMELLGQSREADSDAAQLDRLYKEATEKGLPVSEVKRRMDEILGNSK